MSRPEQCINYLIDDNDNITYLSEQWQPFADGNKAKKIDTTRVIGKRLSDFITDSKCQHIYWLLINRIRQTGGSFKFPFRCDSPDVRRYMEMEVHQHETGQIEFRSCVLQEEPRESVLLLESNIKRSGDLLRICSWCKKVKVDETAWLEVEEAIKKLSLFNAKTLPDLTHGMCPSCYDDVIERIKLMH